MKSAVYFVEVKNIENIPESLGKLDLLISKSGIFSEFKPGWEAAVKIHFGEKGNTGFIKPPYARAIGDAVKNKGTKCFLSDTNTLYRGSRINSADHLELAAEHGFTKEATGMDIIIPDCSRIENTVEISVGQKHIENADVARIFIDADSLVVVTHFKGHGLAGFGGSIKNIGMGCATRKGKLAQHCDVAPIFVAEKCTGCGECVSICPVDALTLIDDKSSLERNKCIGCASCIAACPTSALSVDMGAGNEMQKKMAEYAYAVMSQKKNRCVFINFAVTINKECDCWGNENHPIAPDIGILASHDPVSIDKASYDLVKAECGKDVFHENHPDYDGLIHLNHAHTIGLGNLVYELIKI